MRHSISLTPLVLPVVATLATAAMGERLIEHYGRALADVLLDARDFPLGRLSPGAEEHRPGSEEHHSGSEEHHPGPQAS